MEKPFLHYSPGFPALLKQMNCSVAFSAYRAGKLLFAGSPDGESLNLFAKSFKRPMGVALNHQKLAVAGKFEVDVFKNAPGLLNDFPNKSKDYDALFIPQVTYYTGFTDIHEIAWGPEGLWAVNTTFSCLSLMDEDFNFIPVWQPWFIDRLVPEDRCHMNGFAFDDKGPAYVSMYDSSNVREGWRDSPYDSGLIVDTRKQKVVCDKLPMPHSPRVYGDKLFFLLSATGQVMVYDLTGGGLRELAGLNGFLRGLARFGDHLFVGRSEKRESSRSFKDLPVYQKPCEAGISILNLNTGEEEASLTFSARVQEIFAIEVVENALNPCIIGIDDAQRKHCIHADGGLDFWIRT